MRATRLLLGAMLAACHGCGLASVSASRYLATGAADLSTYELAREARLVGLLGYQTHGVLRTDAGSGGMLGVGVDLTVLAGRARSPYMIGGVQVGLGTGSHPDGWSSWSLGLGHQLLRAGPLGLRAEARYRKLSAESREGVEVGLRIGRAWSRTVSKPASNPIPGTAPQRNLVPPPTSGPIRTGDAASTRAAVIGIAAEAMGTPYRWGGTSSDGFDCSGLIQFAYREVGITLPRRSADQATSGFGVPNELAALLPGDILTFATGAPGIVSHVGLYLGEGQFIHSATGGVQISTLSSTDPYGRWWWQRWVGARRVLP